MNVPSSTLFEAFAPIDAFRKLVELRTGVRPTPTVGMTPLDSYVLKLLSGWHPRVRAVFDLAGDATNGESIALWASHSESHVVKTVVSRDASWSAELANFLRQEGYTQPEWIDPSDVENRLRGEQDTPLIVIAEACGADIVHSLERVHAAAPTSVIVILPVGLTGTDPLLEPLLSWTRETTTQLSLVRELHPCLGTSRMAVLAPVGDAHASAALERISRLFAGNFDFLTLAKQVFSLSQDRAKQDAEVSRLKEASRQAGEQHANAVREIKEWHAAQLWEVNHHREMAAREHEARYNELAAHYHAVAHHNNEVLNSTRWAVASKLMAVRLRLLPPGSVRERLGKKLMKVRRTLRSTVGR